MVLSEPSTLPPTPLHTCVPGNIRAAPIAKEKSYMQWSMSSERHGQCGHAGSHLQAGGIVGVVSPDAAAAAAAARVRRALRNRAAGPVAGAPRASVSPS
jgi:hypothetical protein